MTYLRWLVLLVAACAMPTVPKLGDGKATGVPTPTIADPLNGLPAMSGDGKTLALPTFSTDEHGQERSITFIAVGDTEGPGTTLEMPTVPPEPFITQLTERFRAERYATMAWVVTPDDPPMPMAMTVKDTELYFAGDPKAKLTVAVSTAGKRVGNDFYQVEGETQTSPEHVVAVGATVLWYAEYGLAYVRYDINDGVGRESDWRVVALAKPDAGGAGAAAVPAKAEPAK